MREHDHQTMETPFLDRYTEVLAPSPSTATLARRESPFLSEYLAPDEEAEDATAELMEELLDELRDEELDEAIGALADELSGLADEGPWPESEHGDDMREAGLRQAVAPLVQAAEAEVTRVAEAMRELDLASVSEAEIDEIVEGAPLAAELGNPAFEFFLKKWRKKIARVAKGAVRLATTGPLGLILQPLLAKLRAYARPLVEKVVQLALNKIPAAYRPMAMALAAKFGLKPPAAAGEPAAGASAADGAGAAAASTAPADPASAPVPEEPATPDTAQAQEELDLALAETALMGDRVDREVIGFVPERHPAPARDPYRDLARARVQFIGEITRAEGPEQAGVAVERFIPAVLMAVRAATKIAGRGRVVNLLGGVIGQLISPVVGKANAPALGKVLADVGLRTFLQAEAEPEAQLEAAGQAIAATVEETVRRVARLPEEMLVEPEALEAFTYEAFQGAAAAHFPAALVRPELRETEQPGMWIALPGGRGSKFSHVFDVTLTPPVARAVRGFGSSSLAGLLRDRLRLSPAATVTARLHLYQAGPGTRLSAIARGEQARGLGSSDPAVSSQIQPLTPEAAALLLGSPRLGRELAEDGEDTPRVGQRFYYLEVAGAPPRPLGKESHVHAALDLRQGQVRLCLYLSEVVAQKVASALRAKRAPAAVVAELRGLMGPATAALGQATSRRLVRVVGARRHRAARRRTGAAGRAARRALRRQIGTLALQWAWQHLARSLDTIGPDFIAKTEGPEDGLRLAFSFQMPDGLRTLAPVFRGRALAAPAWTPRDPTRTTLTLHAGPQHG